MLHFFLEVSITGQFLTYAFKQIPNACLLPTRQQVAWVSDIQYLACSWRKHEVLEIARLVERKTRYTAILGQISFLGLSRSFPVSPPCSLSWRLTCADHSKEAPSPGFHLALAGEEPRQNTREKGAEWGLGVYPPDSFPAGSPLAAVFLTWQSLLLSSWPALCSSLSSVLVNPFLPSLHPPYLASYHSGHRDGEEHGCCQSWIPR